MVQRRTLTTEPGGPGCAHVGCCSPPFQACSDPRARARPSVSPGRARGAGGQGRAELHSEGTAGQPALEKRVCRPPRPSAHHPPATPAPSTGKEALRAAPSPQLLQAPHQGGGRPPKPARRGQASLRRRCRHLPSERAVQAPSGPSATGSRAWGMGSAWGRGSQVAVATRWPSSLSRIRNSIGCPSSW